MLKEFISFFIVVNLTQDPMSSNKLNCMPICLFLDNNFKCYIDYVTTILQILYARSDRLESTTHFLGFFYVKMKLLRKSKSQN